MLKNITVVEIGKAGDNGTNDTLMRLPTKKEQKRFMRQYENGVQKYGLFSKKRLFNKVSCYSPY